METQLLISLLAILCTALSLLIGFLTFNRNRDKDVKRDASESAVIKTKLDTISSGIESIRIDIKANEKKVIELAERVIRVEEISKLAHSRIDHLESKGEKDE